MRNRMKFLYHVKFYKVKCQWSCIFHYQTSVFYLLRHSFVYLLYLYNLVNNYEINSIHDLYLTIWYKNADNNYITINQLKQSILDSRNMFFPLFFSASILTYCLYNNYNIGEVYIDNFFQFVCTFLFFTHQQIITLLLSFAQIQSNVFITYVYIYIYI